MLEIEEGEGTCCVNVDMILHPVRYQYVLICKLRLKDNRSHWHASGQRVGHTGVMLFS